MAVFQNNLCQEINYSIDYHTDYLAEHLRNKHFEFKDDSKFLSSLNYSQFSTFQSVKLILQNPSTYNFKENSVAIYACRTEHRLEGIFLLYLREYVLPVVGYRLDLEISNTSLIESVYSYGDFKTTYLFKLTKI